MPKVKARSVKTKKPTEFKPTGPNSACARCVLHKTSTVASKSLVCLWGAGNQQSDIMLVGEAPGKDEILQEQPFIGEAGQLLGRYLQKAELERKDMWITNTTKCRPPQNRPPKPMEMRACAPYLDYEIEQQKPKVIGLLGAVALKRVLGVDGITKLRGTPIWSHKYNCYCVPTWHPSFILRNGETFVHTEQFLKDLKLIKRIGETGETGRTATKVEVCDDIDAFDALIHVLKHSAQVTAVDTETVGNYITGKILSMQFCFQPGVSYVLPLLKTGKELTPVWTDEELDYIISQLKEFLEDAKYKKVGQNIKYDYQFFKLYGITLRGVIFDTMLASYLLNENDKKGHNLTDLGLKFTDMGDYSLELYEILGVKANEINENSYATAPFEALCKYGGKDVDCTFRVFCVLFPRIKKLGLMPLLTKVMVPLSFALADMELTGVAIDVNYYKRLTNEYEIKINTLDKKLQSFLEVKKLEKQQEKPVNFRSTLQLRVLFYEILRLPILKYTSTKGRKNKNAKTPSTDKEVLAKLAEIHEIPKLLQEYRKLNKFLSTYIKPMPDLVKEDGRVHTSYKQISTTTGRLASSNPNLQNIPKKEPEKANEVRNGIIATPGFKFIEADFAQIEFRLLANECGDETMIKDVKDPNVDIHRYIASIAFNVKYDEVSKELRELAKTIVYSVIYGKSKENLAKETGLSVEEVEHVFDALFNHYPKMKTWMERIVKRAESVGEVINWIGRRRRLADGFKSGVDILMDQARKQAVNSPIQGGAHDIVSIATLRVRKALKEKNLQSRLVMTIHDALILEAKDEEFEDVVKILKTEMERPIPRIVVPMVVDMAVGTRLGEMKELNVKEIIQ